MEERKIPYIIQYPGDFGGCGFWRMLWPQLVMNMKGIAKVSHSQMFIRDFLHYSRAQAVHIQRQTRANQHAFFKKLSELKNRMNFRLIYDVDDIIFEDDIPDYNGAKEKLKDLTQYAIDIIECCDEFIVTTPFLKEYYLQKTKQKNITVIPNYPPAFWIGNYYSEELILRNYRAHKNKPRVLYSGSASHFDRVSKGKCMPDDFTHVEEAIMANAGDITWVFVGSMPKCLEPQVRAGLIEYHPWQQLDNYPRYLAHLQLNMAIAPLKENDFNLAKSDLKFLEASALGIPIACQDLVTYAVAPIKFKTGEEMIKKIHETLYSEETFLDASRKARTLLEGRWLERPENIGKYIDVYTTPYGHSSRKYL